MNYQIPVRPIHIGPVAHICIDELDLPTRKAVEHVVFPGGPGCPECNNQRPTMTVGEFEEQIACDDYDGISGILDEFIKNVREAMFNHFGEESFGGDGYSKDFDMIFYYQV